MKGGIANCLYCRSWSVMHWRYLVLSMDILPRGLVVVDLPAEEDATAAVKVVGVPENMMFVLEVKVRVDERNCNFPIVIHFHLMGVVVRHCFRLRLHWVVCCCEDKASAMYREDGSTTVSAESLLLLF